MYKICKRFFASFLFIRNNVWNRWLLFLSVVPFLSSPLLDWVLIIIENFLNVLSYFLLVSWFVFSENKMLTDFVILTFYLFFLNSWFWWSCENFQFHILIINIYKAKCNDKFNFISFFIFFFLLHFLFVVCRVFAIKEKQNSTFYKFCSIFSNQNSNSGKILIGIEDFISIILMNNNQIRK